MADIVEGGGADIASVMFLANGQQVGNAVSLSRDNAYENANRSLIRPYAYQSHEFEATITFPAAVGINTVEARTSGNAVGNTGHDSVTVHVIEEPVPLGSPAGALLVANTVVPEGGFTSEADQVTFYWGDRGPLEGDAILEETGPTSMVFEDVTLDYLFSSGSVTTRLQIADFTGLDPYSEDGFTGTVSTLSNGTVVSELQLEFTETGNDTRRFTAELATSLAAGGPGAAVKIDAVANDQGSGAGDWQPFLVRVKAPPDALANAYGEVAGGTYKLVEHDGWHYFATNPIRVFAPVPGATYPKLVLLERGIATQSSLFLHVGGRPIIRASKKLQAFPGVAIRPAEGEADKPITVKLSVMGTERFRQGDSFAIDGLTAAGAATLTADGALEREFVVTSATGLGYKKITIDAVDEAHATGWRTNPSGISSLFAVIGDPIVMPLASHGSAERPAGCFVDWMPPFRYDFQGVKQGTPAPAAFPDASRMLFRAAYLEHGASGVQWEVTKGGQSFGTISHADRYSAWYAPGNATGEATLNLYLVKEGVRSANPDATRTLYVYEDHLARDIANFGHDKPCFPCDPAELPGATRPIRYNCYTSVEQHTVGGLLRNMHRYQDATYRTWPNPRTTDYPVADWGVALQGLGRGDVIEVYAYSTYTHPVLGEQQTTEAVEHVQVATGNARETYSANNQPGLPPSFRWFRATTQQYADALHGDSWTRTEHFGETTHTGVVTKIKVYSKPAEE